MAQIFRHSTNLISRLSIYGAAFIVAALGYAVYGLTGSPYVTDVNVARDQPVPFSHKHHVGELGIDCRYCHNSVEKSGYAGIPPTKICMNCHQQIWTGAELLQPVREGYRLDKPIVWNRVHNTPHYVYFNHSIHISK